MDPDAFAGTDALVREMGHLDESCRASPAARDFGRVRVPGDRAVEVLARSRQEGTRLPGKVLGRVAACAGELGVPLPRRLG